MILTSLTRDLSTTHSDAASETMDRIRTDREFVLKKLIGNTLSVAHLMLLQACEHYTEIEATGLRSHSSALVFESKPYRLTAQLASRHDRVPKQSVASYGLILYHFGTRMYYVFRLKLFT